MEKAAPAERAAVARAAAKAAAEKAAAEKAAAEKVEAEIWLKVAARAAVARAAAKPAAEKAAAEKAKAAALGLLQPLEALLLDTGTLRRATAAAVTYCDAKGIASFPDLVERASRLIAHPHCRRRSLIALGLVRVALGCGPQMPSHDPCWGLI